MSGQEVKSKLDGILYTGNDRFFSSQYSSNNEPQSFKPISLGMHATSFSHRPNTQSAYTR